MVGGGDLTLYRGTKIKASDTACGIYTVAGEPGIYNKSKITVDNSTIKVINNAAIIVNRRETNVDTVNKTDIILQNDSKVSSGNGIGLLINNSYIGKNGTMTFNSKTTSDRVFPDKMIIHGNSLGNTNIAINNIGGTSDAHLNRLELIHVDGSSNAVFNQSGRIVAGAYNYSLVRGRGRNAGNWYLSSQPTLNDPEARGIRSLG